MAEANVPSGAVENGAGTPPDIPGHNLLRRIGRGSYGEVWLAQSAQGEYRAAKIVYRNSFERERPFEREYSGIQKFEPVSRTHPSQVSILQVGRNDADGYFYYVMELADDDSGRDPASPRLINPDTYKPRTLRSEVTGHGRIPFDRALDISLALTKALEHLHQHGLIHRDIKPSNIIFVDGVPKLADIGLVTDVGASISYVGTEGFLPPEGPVSQQADIYSLGKVLYEMSTGQDRMEFPELPTFLGAAEEKEGLLELNLVFLKACQNDPQKRYGTAQEMYADLAILRGGKSLKRTRALERRLTSITRAFASTAAAGLIAALGYYAWNQQRLKRLEEDVERREREKQIAQNAARSTERQLVDLYLAVGEQLRKEGDAGGALAWYSRALAEDTDPARLEDHRQRIIGRLGALARIAGFVAVPSQVNSATFGAAGQRLVTAGEDSIVRIWNLAGEPAGKPLRHKSPVAHAALSPDGQRLLSICKDGSAWLWTIGDETVAFELVDRVAVRSGSFSPNGRFVVTNGDSNDVVVWDALNCRERLRLAHAAAPGLAKYTPDGNSIVVLAAEKLYVWEAERGRKVCETSSPIRGPRDFVFSADSRRVLVLAEQAAQVCSIPNGDWSVSSFRESTPITAAGFAPDGRTIITGTTDGLVRVWNSITAQPVADPWHLQKPVTRLAISPDQSAFICASEREGWVVDLKSREITALPGGNRGRVQDVAFDVDARHMLTASTDGALWITEMPSRAGSAISHRSYTPEQIGNLCGLLSGREVNEQEQLVSIDPSKLNMAWQQLNANRSFTAVAPVHWHRARAEEFHAAGLWFGLHFHTERLRELAPMDDTAQQWAAKATVELMRTDRPSTNVTKIPARASDAPEALVDLTEYYNASLNETWLPNSHVGHRNDFSQLPSGSQTFNGVPFDARGVIQLSGVALESLGGQFPKEVRGISIGRKASHIHFLHGTAWDALYGTVIGKYVVRYRNGETLEVKIVYGKNVRNWWYPPTQPQTTLEAAVAWEGYNPASRQMGMALRLYQFKWRNPMADVEIESIDFLTTMQKPAPFLLAITTEAVR